MKLRKFALGVFFALTGCFLFAREAVFTNEDYEIKLHYNDTAYPGDALFVRMKISLAGKKSRNLKNDLSETTASLSLFIDNKSVDKSMFYVLPKESNKNQITFLTGIPLSSWWTEDAECMLLVKYNLFGIKEYEFKLPFSLMHKDFVSETLELDQRNTDIKTDVSPKRMQQIEKLNGILSTVNNDAVYQLQAFVPPTPATRRTSYFAERRVYAYTNGKSSTSLHFGTDYGVPEGSEVTACADGKVVMAEERVSTGWSIVVEHLPGLYSLYYHLSKMQVKEGDTVKAGELIGYSGSTGLATGPHLHWEMRLNMSAVNPDFFVNNDFTFSKVSN